MTKGLQFRLAGDGAWHLGLLARRSYHWDSDGSLRVSTEQRRPIDEEATAAKPCTDVVLEGAIYAPGGGLRSVVAQLEVGDVVRRIRANGPREIVDSRGGHAEWSSPRVFDRAPLSRELAYGGFDSVAFEREGDDAALAAAELGADVCVVSRFAYPRNAQGIGFYMADNGVANRGRAVPCLEDPDDPVLPERLLRSGPLDWIDAPIPACWGWSEPDDFPRSRLLGFHVDHRAPLRPVREIELGALDPADLADRPAPAGLTGLPHGLAGEPRSHQAASPGLGTRRLSGGETIRLTNLEPARGERLLRLPRALPSLLLRPPGCDHFELEPQIDSVVIRPDARELSIVYSGRLRVAGRYPEVELALVESAVRWAD